MSDERGLTVEETPIHNLRTRSSCDRQRLKTFRKFTRGFSRVFKKEKNPKDTCEFDPEILCRQKKEWLDLRSTQGNGIDWPQHCFEHLIIVGLPHTMDIKEVINRIEVEKTLHKRPSANSSSASVKSEKSNHTPASPSYTPELLYQFPEEKELHMKPEELVSFCFPHGVTPQILKRTASMSALNEVVYGQQHLIHSDQSFVFLQKGGDDLPMFGVCYLVNQMLHTPPGLVKHKYKETRHSTQKKLVAAPRCYCLLSRYPFFTLHFQVLNLLLGLERLDSISDYMNEIMKLPLDSSLFNRLESKPTANSHYSSRFNSVTPDSAAIRAYSASPTPPPEMFLERQSYSRSDIDERSQTPRRRVMGKEGLLTHERDSFSGFPGLLHSFSGVIGNGGGAGSIGGTCSGVALPLSERHFKHRGLVLSSSSGFRDQVQNSSTAAIIAENANTWYCSNCCCFCCSFSDDVSSPCRDCCFLNKMESEKTFQQHQPSSTATGAAATGTTNHIQKSSVWQGSPIPPRYPDHDQHHRGSLRQGGVQDIADGSLTPSNSHQLNNARNGQGFDLSDQESKSVFGGFYSHSRSVSGQSSRDCYDSMESANYFTTCFATVPSATTITTNTTAHSIADSCGYNGSSEYRACSTSPVSSHHQYTRSGDSEIFMSSSSMPDLATSCGGGGRGGSAYCSSVNNGDVSNIINHQERSCPVVLPSAKGYLPFSQTTASVSSIFKCPSVGEITRFPSRNATRTWSEDQSDSPIPACQKLLRHFRDLKVPAPGETIVFVPEEKGLQKIEFTRIKSRHHFHQEHEITSNGCRFLNQGQDQDDPTGIENKSSHKEECSVDDQASSQKDHQRHSNDDNIDHHHQPHQQQQHETLSCLSSDLAQIEMETVMGLRTWTVAVLCRSLSLENVLTLLAGALLEKQIVFFCSNIGILTSAVLSLIPLLQPFSWQSLILPALPSQYIELLEAPVPFAVGIQHKTPEIVLHCKEVIRVNLYKDKIKNAPLNSSLPGYKSLHSRLSHWHKQLQNCSKYCRRPSHMVTLKEYEAVENFLSVLRGHLSGLLAELQCHTITDVTSKNGVSLLMEESFVRAFPVKDQPFMKAFTQTQMFSHYVDTIIGDKKN